MGGRRTSEEELQQIELFISEGLTDKEIGERLERSEAGIRNIRYRNRLIKRAVDESETILQRRDELKRNYESLRKQKALLVQEVKCLEKEKEKLETVINSNKTLLQNVLVQGLINLKQQRPDLFVLTDQDQIITLARLFLGFLKK